MCNLAFGEYHVYIYIYVDGKHMGHVIWLICHCYGDAMGSFWLNEN